MNITCINNEGITHYFASISPGSDQKFFSSLGELAQDFHNRDATILKMDIFGSLEVFPECMKTIRTEFGNIEWPVSYVEGEGCFDSRYAGIQVYAISGVPVETIHLNGNPIGRIYGCDLSRS